MSNENSYSLSPLGDCAILVCFGHEIKQSIHAEVTALSILLNNQPLLGMVETIPAYTTLTVIYDPLCISEHEASQSPYEFIKEALHQRLADLITLPPVTLPCIDIPVCYDETFGLDLAYVADFHGLTIQEVIHIHSAAVYTVYMLGFVPGFPYLGGMSEQIATPRKSTPRLAIPAGSVGIADTQTGIYPIETPGGWQVIGRTPLCLFQANRPNPTLLQAGNTIRFKPISREEYHQFEVV